MHQKLKSLIAFFFLLFIVSTSAFGQNIDDRLKTQYLYTLNNVSSIEQISSIQSEIESLKFVEKVKLNFKDESSGMAQIIIFVNEPKRTTEDQVMFQPNQLKKLIFIDNMDLTDLKINKY